MNIILNLNFSGHEILLENSHAVDLCIVYGCLCTTVAELTIVTETGPVTGKHTACVTAMALPIAVTVIT